MINLFPDLIFLKRYVAHDSWDTSLATTKNQSTHIQAVYISGRPRIVIGWVFEVKESSKIVKFTQLIDLISSS